MELSSNEKRLIAEKTARENFGQTDGINFDSHLISQENNQFVYKFTNDKYNIESQLIEEVVVVKKKVFFQPEVKGWSIGKPYYSFNSNLSKNYKITEKMFYGIEEGDQVEMSILDAEHTRYHALLIAIK